MAIVLVVFATLPCCGGGGDAGQYMRVDIGSSASSDCGPPLPESDCSKVAEFPAGIDTVKCEGNKLVATWKFSSTCPGDTDQKVSLTYTCTYVCKNQCKIPFYGCVDPLHGKALVADICK